MPTDLLVSYRRQSLDAVGLVLQGVHPGATTHRRKTGKLRPRPTASGTDFRYPVEQQTWLLTSERWFSLSLRIFLVEDSLTIRLSLMDMLTDLVDACLVGAAETQSDAIQWLSEHPDGWDVAIVDLFLKRGSGLPVVKACAGRALKQRVLVLSNYATPEIRAQAMNLGVDRVFDKSQDVDALIDYCRQVNQALYPP